MVPLRIVAYWKLNDGDTWRRNILDRDKQLEKGARNPLNNWYLSWTCVTEFANVGRSSPMGPWALAFVGFPALRIAARPSVRMYSNLKNQLLSMSGPCSLQSYMPKIIFFSLSFCFLIIFKPSGDWNQAAQANPLSFSVNSVEWICRQSNQGTLGKILMYTQLTLSSESWRNILARKVLPVASFQALQLVERKHSAVDFAQNIFIPS